MKAWACDRCDELHTQNPESCRSCGHPIFRPVSVTELENRSSGSEKSDSFEPSYTVGSKPDPEFDGSPDLNPDGSVKRDDRSGDDSDETGILGRLLAFIR